jgi:AraC-like DNA-binding protein
MSVTSAALAVPYDAAENARVSKPSGRAARHWRCHVSVRVAHSCPLVAAGLIATFQQEPGYDVAAADAPSSASARVAGGVHVLITDLGSDIQLLTRGCPTVSRDDSPRPRVVLLSSEAPLAPRAGTTLGIDACLPIDCATEDLLAVVRKLGRAALGPLAQVEHELSWGAPQRGGLSPGVLQAVRRYIDDHLAAGAALESLARIAGVSCCHFARAFRRSMGMPAHRYLITRRISAAIALIRETDRPLCEIALDVGFSDQSHFTRTFVQLTGLTPGAFRYRCH